VVFLWLSNERDWESSSPQSPTLLALTQEAQPKSRTNHTVQPWQTCYLCPSLELLRATLHSGSTSVTSCMTNVIVWTQLQLCFAFRQWNATFSYCWSPKRLWRIKVSVLLINTIYNTIQQLYLTWSIHLPSVMTHLIHSCQNGVCNDAPATFQECNKISAPSGQILRAVLQIDWGHTSTRNELDNSMLWYTCDRPCFSSSSWWT
jgi:hypothetical protein